MTSASTPYSWLDDNDDDDGDDGDDGDGDDDDGDDDDDDNDGYNSDDDSLHLPSLMWVSSSSWLLVTDTGALLL